MQVMDRYVISRAGQWLADIAIRESGSFDSIIALAIANDMSITDDLAIGEESIIRPDVLDRKVVKYYRDNNIRPATALSGYSQGAGIGDWAIEVNFIVS